MSANSMNVWKVWALAGPILGMGIGAYPGLVHVCLPEGKDETEKKILDAKNDLRDRFHILDVNTTGYLHECQGIDASQNPNDVAVIRGIIWDRKPDFVVETGTSKGGSALSWAEALYFANPDGRVITVDLESSAKYSVQARSRPIAKEKINFLFGSSTSEEIIHKIERELKEKEKTLQRPVEVLVILDSDHSRDHVLNELELYHRFIRKDGVLVVQDTHFHGHPLPGTKPGPMEAVEAFLEKHSEFEYDRTLEPKNYTHCPKGYLRRQ